jgi:hypothetical protein
MYLAHETMTLRDAEHTNISRQWFFPNLYIYGIFFADVLSYLSVLNEGTQKSRWTHHYTSFVIQGPIPVFHFKVEEFQCGNKASDVSRTCSKKSEYICALLRTP